MGERRGFLAIVVGIAVLLVVTVAVVLLAGDRAPKAYPAGSPEAAYQSFLAAWDAGDDATAWTYFTPEVQATTTLADYRRQAADYRASALPPGATRRVFIDAASVSGETATLAVTVATTVITGLGSSRQRAASAVTLVRRDGTWKLDALRMGTETWWPSKL